MFPLPPNIASDWYWSNYIKGMEWVKRHEIAYWKSQAMALSYENNQLYQTLHDSNQGSNRRHRDRNTNNLGRRKRKGKNASDKSSISVEVSQELKDFFKASIQHKEKLKKEKELREELDSEFTPPQVAKDLRLKEMKELYGDDHSAIIGMETAMQLSFERYMDHKSPKHWPQLPFQF